MNKTVISILSILAFLASMAVLVLQGFGMSAISPLLHILLRVLAGFSAQAFAALNFRHPVMQALPLILTALLGIWGGCLFVLSADWQDPALDGYLTDYCTPVLGSILATGLFRQEQGRHL